MFTSCYTSRQKLHIEYNIIYNICMHHMYHVRYIYTHAHIHVVIITYTYALFMYEHKSSYIENYIYVYIFSVYSISIHNE